jgi:putative transposase
MAIKIQHAIRTLRLKVKAEGYVWLNKAAIEVNEVWNFANATSYKAARPVAGPSKWLTAYDLDKLTAGATEYFEHIGADTIQRINAEFATRRKQVRKAKLRCDSRSGREFGPEHVVRAEVAPVRERERATVFSRGAEPDI